MPPPAAQRGFQILGTSETEGLVVIHVFSDCERNRGGGLMMFRQSTDVGSHLSFRCSFMILRFGPSYHLIRDLRERWKPLQKDGFRSFFSHFLSGSDSGFTVVRRSPGGALDRQHGLDFAINPQMRLVSHTALVAGCSGGDDQVASIGDEALAGRLRSYSSCPWSTVGQALGLGQWEVMHGPMP